jgi:hypothetical protein
VHRDAILAPRARRQSFDFDTRIARANVLGHHMTQGHTPASGAQSIQAKLTVGPIDDAYEREADQVASQVVASLDAGAAASHATSDPASGIARQETAEEEPLERMAEDELEDDTLSRMADDELDDEELALQTKPASGTGPQGGVTDAAIESGIERSRSGGRPIEASLRGSMESAFGADFGGVRVHTDGQSDQLNRSLQARAFTTGQDVFFRQGEYQPQAKASRELLAHELTHVVQQTGAKPVKESS